MKKIRKILVVEDEKSYADLIQLTFERRQLPFRLEFVENISNARTLLEEDHDYDLLITDWLLPDGTGEELLELLNREKGKVPAIMITSQGSEELAVKCFKMGVMDYFTKTPQAFSNLPLSAMRVIREHDNVRQREIAEERLRESERKYRLITDNITDIVWTIDLSDNNYSYISPSIANFVGYESEVFIGKSAFFALSPFSAKKARDKIVYLKSLSQAGKLNSDEKIELELAFVHKNGNLRWGETKGSLLINNGKLTGITGVTRDITDKKAAEENLRIQQIYFQTLIQQAPVAIAILDKEDRVQQVNEKFISLFGYKLQEVKGIPINDCIVPVHLKEEGRLLTNNVARGEDVYHESVRQAKDGSLLDVLIIGEPVIIEGEQVAVFGIYQDISEQKQSRDALRKLSERLVMATSAAGIGIWDYNLQTDQMVWEPEMYTLHDIGVTEARDLKNDWQKCIHPHDRKILISLLDSWKTQKQIYEESYRVVKKDNSIRYIKIFCSVVKDETGQPLRLIGVCWDNTREIEHTELERKVEVADKVASIKQQFLANMSHEIRSPMTGIIGMTELLMKTSLDEKQKHFLETIHASSNSLLTIVNDILDLSKIEAGRMEVKPSVFNLKNCGQRTIDLFSALAEQKNLELSFEFDPELPEMIKTDENRLAQVVSNLLSNAIKFTEKGFVKLSCSLEKTGENSLEIKVTVEDSGIGISEENQQRLFNIFSQVDGSDTRNYEGTGLGLSISQKLAELLGGKIGVESEQGKGSRFWFIFKAEKVNQEPQPGTSESGKSGELPHLPYRVLLVEDKKTNQMVLSLMLKEAGAEVVIADNGKDALEKYTPGAFDLILMDIQMPVMDGITAVKELKSLHGHEKVPPILGLSAKAMEGDAEHYISQGLDDYLTKPVPANRLYQKIQQWTESRLRRQDD